MQNKAMLDWRPGNDEATSFVILSILIFVILMRLSFVILSLSKRFVLDVSS
jgi:hypothetical protein